MVNRVGSLAQWSKRGRRRDAPVTPRRIAQKDPPPRRTALLTQTDQPAEPFAGETEEYRRAMRYLYDRIDYERLAARATTRYPFRLQRVTELLGELGLQPYLAAETDRPKVPLVHIAGTKGKGSVAAMVAASLTACGLRTGLYTSPHLHRLEERFRIDGQSCQPAELVSLVTRVEEAAQEVERVSGPASFFELTTALALLHFDRSDCDALVIEVGLGGRLDSTNVVAPSVSVVTSIGLDHQHVLGHDLPSIAYEKAGIIKPGIPVVSGVADQSAVEVIETKARENDAPLFAIGRDFDFRCKPLSGWGSHVTFQGQTPPLSPRIEVRLEMEGQHQARNAAIALASLELLRDRQSASDQPIDVSPDKTASAFTSLQCEARVERLKLKDDVTAIVDASHNEESIAALCDCIRDRSDGRNVTVVFGTSIDKPAKAMLGQLATVADQLILTRYHGNPRFMPPDQLHDSFNAGSDVSSIVIEDPLEACRRGLQLASPGGLLVVCGSFFLAAETRLWLLSHRLE